MALSGALWVFLRATEHGQGDARGRPQNRDVAMLMGINPNRVFCVAPWRGHWHWPAAAGSLLMPFYSALPVSSARSFVLMAFVAVVLGTPRQCHRRRWSPA